MHNTKLPYRYAMLVGKGFLANCGFVRYALIDWLDCPQESVSIFTLADVSIFYLNEYNVESISFKLVIYLWVGKYC